MARISADVSEEEKRLANEARGDRTWREAILEALNVPHEKLMRGRARKEVFESAMEATKDE